MNRPKVIKVRDGVSQGAVRFAVLPAVEIQIIHLLELLEAECLCSSDEGEHLWSIIAELEEELMWRGLRLQDGAWVLSGSGCLHPVIVATAKRPPQ